MSEDWYAKFQVGIVTMRGDDALDLLNRLSTNDLSVIEPGEVVQTLLTTSQGKLVDWLRVVRNAELALVCSPGRAAAVIDWLERYTIMEDSSVSLLGDPVTALRWIGPRARAWSAHHADSASRFDLEGTIVLPAPVAWGEGVDLVLPSRDVDGLIGELGLGDTEAIDERSYEHRRILAGVPSHKWEFVEPINPLSLRLAPLAVSFTKGCYIGQEVLSRVQAYDKLARVLMGWSSSTALSLDDSSRIVVDGRSVGRPTSSSTLNGDLQGLAIVNRDYARELPALLRGSTGEHPIRLLDRPFWTAPVHPG